MRAVRMEEVGEEGGDGGRADVPAHHHVSLALLLHEAARVPTARPEDVHNLGDRTRKHGLYVHRGMFEIYSNKNLQYENTSER